MLVLLMLMLLNFAAVDVVATPPLTFLTKKFEKNFHKRFLPENRKKYSSRIFSVASEKQLISISLFAFKCGGASSLSVVLRSNPDSRFNFFRKGLSLLKLIFFLRKEKIILSVPGLGPRAAE